MRWLSAPVNFTGIPPDWDSEVYAKMAKRVSKMASYELLEWADVCGSGMAKAYSDLRKELTQESLAEIREGLMALWAVTRELELRRLAGV